MDGNTKSKTRRKAAQTQTATQPPILLCQPHGHDLFHYEYLVGLDGALVTIRECVQNRNDGWAQGRTICAEKRERASEVFAVCALLNRLYSRLVDWRPLIDDQIAKGMSDRLEQVTKPPQSIMVEKEDYFGKEKQ
jgi:hypothetical protein